MGRWKRVCHCIGLNPSFFFIDYKYKFGIIKLLILILLFIIETLVSVVALFGRHPATEGVEF